MWSLKAMRSSLLELLILMCGCPMVLGRIIVTSPYMIYRQPLAHGRLSPCHYSMHIQDATQYQHFIQTAWSTWGAFSEVTNAFCSLAEGPSEITEDVFQSLERFTVLMYDRTSESNSVNEVRKHLFTAKGRTLQNIPPTAAALEQHVKRAALQGGHIWGHAQDSQLLKSPLLNGGGLKCLESGSHYGPLSQVRCVGVSSDVAA